MNIDYVQETSSKSLLSAKTALAFTAVLGLVLIAHNVYNDQLYDISYDVIKTLQTGRSEASFDFYTWVGRVTDEGIYAITLVMMFPFMARERFCYLLVAFHVADFVKTTFKNSFHEPRPVFMWSDMSPHTCAMTFGLPSGHSAESANFVLVLLLDQFKPSRWSKSTYPQLNSRTSQNSPQALAAMLLLVFTYWPMVVYDRIVLGKHTLNQVLLGSQIGFWCACFSHFCLRDFVYCHVTKIINGETRLAKEKALKYTLNAAKFVAVLFSFQVVVAYLGALFLRIDPTWLKNLVNTCGQKFQTDEDGNYIVEDKFATFFAKGIPSVASHLCTVLGLYIGLIAYRYSANRRLGPNAFESESPLNGMID